MLGLKFITVVLLIAAASPSQATPAPSPSGSGDLLGNLLGNIFGLLGGVLDKLFGDWKGDKSGLIDILTTFLNNILKSIPKTIDELIVVLAKLGYVLEKILNYLVPGLGTAVAKVYFAVLHFVFCLLGSPGLTGSLFGGKWSKPSICHKGLYPSGGVNGNCDEKKCKEIIRQGCSEGNKIWEDIVVDINIDGFLGVCLRACLNLFTYGNTCSGDDYEINIDDVLYILVHVIFPIYGGACKNYGIVGNLLEFIRNLLDSVFKGYKYDYDYIKNETDKCGGDKGFHNLPECFKKNN